MSNWIDACAVDDVAHEAVTRFDHGDRSFAVYRGPDGSFFCTDGYCTHEMVHLEDGRVRDYMIVCPKHNGRFDYRTGKATGAPACVALATYPVRIARGRVLVDIG